MFTKNYGKEGRHPVHLGRRQRKVPGGETNPLLILRERIQVRVESMARDAQAGSVGR